MLPPHILSFLHAYSIYLDFERGKSVRGIQPRTESMLCVHLTAVSGSVKYVDAPRWA